jgi:hypothetical protein
MPPLAFELNDPTVISETIDGETIIINLASGTYYSLKHSGAIIWSGIQQAASVVQIAALIRSNFQIDGEDVEGDISSLIHRLCEEDLIRPKGPGESRAGLSAPLAEMQLSPYQAPILEKFTDLETMLLLDPVHDVTEEGWPHLPAGKRDA